LSRNSREKDLKALEYPDLNFQIGDLETLEAQAAAGGPRQSGRATQNDPPRRRQ
jgi:hypothetical protein